MAVTIYDLAREAGVSISTVSKALSDSYTISGKTKRHVLKTARRLQYKPNARARSRLKGMDAVVREEALSVEMLFGDSPYTEDIEALKRILCGEARPEVALCANNRIALECLQCAMQLGLRIPQDLALMTFDRYPFSQLLIPRLTAVEVDMFDMGWEAARFLIQKIKKPGLQGQTFCTTPRLIEGEST